MQDSTTREKILKKIRKALIHHQPQPYPNIDWDKNVYSVSDATLEETFAKEFTAVGGHFVFCEDEIDFLEQLVHLCADSGWKEIISEEKSICELLNKVDFPYKKHEEGNKFNEGIVAVTSCEFLVARLGSIIISSKTESGRRSATIAASHIVLAYTSQIVPDLKDALAKLKEKYGEQLPSFILNIAGPSRTADIEKTLVTPAHGPKDIFVFLIDDKTTNYESSRITNEGKPIS